MAKILGSLDIGDRIELSLNDAHKTRFGNKMIFRVVAKGTYPYSNSVTLITEHALCMIPFDVPEPYNINQSRKTYGNDRYAHSNLHQWLSSDAKDGTWYVSQHSADTPPSRERTVLPYEDWPGFLACFEPGFLSQVLTSSFSCTKNQNADYPSGSETVSAKFFLPSDYEMGIGGSSIGIFPAFRETNDRVAWAATSAMTRVKYYTRTNIADHVGKLIIVNAMGYQDRAPASNADKDVWIRPICNVQNTAPISEKKNAAGNYVFMLSSPPTTPAGISVPATHYSNRDMVITWGASTDPDGDAVTYHVERSPNSGDFVRVTTTSGTTCRDLILPAWDTVSYRVKAVDTHGHESAYMTSSLCAVLHNQAPKISGEDGDLGEALGVAYFDYTVTDAEGDRVDVVEAVDGTVVRSHTVELEMTYRAVVDGDRFAQLVNGRHALTITATDAVGNVTTRTLAFTKRATRFTVELSQPLASATQPRRVNAFAHCAIPTGASFLIEASNNPYDVTPTWEDITRAVLQGTAHVFANESQHDQRSGLSLRATVERRNAVGECWLSGIGGNFE